MRIVYHCNIDLSLGGGPASHVAEVARALRGLSHEVLLVAPGIRGALVDPDVPLQCYGLEKPDPSAARHPRGGRHAARASHGLRCHRLWHRADEVSWLL